MNVPTKRKFSQMSGLGAAALVITAALGLSACSGASPAANSDKVKITVGASTSVFSMPVRHAIQSGIFDKAGLEVEVVDVQSTSDGAALLANGEIQFTQGDVHNTILAQEQGTPLTISAPIAVTATKPPADGIGFGNLFVLDNKGLNNVKDLEGKKVGTNTIGGTGYLDFVQAFGNAGVNVDKVQWIQVPSPQLISALRQGQIDAAVVSEPNGTVALQAGGVKVLANADSVMAGAPNFGYLSSTSWLAENGATAKKFQTAVIEANKAVNADRGKAEEAIASYMKLDAKVIKDFRLPDYAEEAFTAKSVQPVADRLVKFGIIKSDKMPDLAKVVWTE